MSFEHLRLERRKQMKLMKLWLSSAVIAAVAPGIAVLCCLAVKTGQRQ